MSKRILVLQCRGLGDAVMSSSLINSLHGTGEEVLVDVWASERVAPIFERHPFVNRCYVQRFPVLRRDRWKFSAPFSLFGQVRELRENRYDLALNVVGDVRENFLTALVGARSSWSVVWEDGHPIKKLLHPGLRRLITHNELIPDSCRNIYEVYERVVDGISDWEKIERGGVQEVEYGSTVSARKKARRIGVHPLAGQACREWPVGKWNELIREILELGYEVTVFGAPSERGALEAGFEAWIEDPRVSIVAGTLGAFVDSIGGLAAFVGLDSFGVHAAHEKGIPSVMINGANDPSVWAPPNTRVVGHGGGCSSYPCYNRPKCIDTEHEYSCIRTISVREVLNALREVVGLDYGRSEMPSRWRTEPRASRARTTPDVASKLGIFSHD